MQVIVTSTIQQPTLLQSLEEVPSARIVFEQLDTLDGGKRKGSFWVEADDYDAFEAAMDDDPTVTAIRHLTTFNDRRLYQAEQIGEGREKSVYPTLVDVGGIIQRMVGTRNGWEFQVAFPSHEALSQFHDVCREHELGFILQQKYEQSDDGEGGSDYGLSEKQRQMLAYAVEAGYFEVPREVDLTDIAAELDISHQAASERLRRATNVLARNTVCKTEIAAEADRATVTPPTSPADK